MLHYTSQSSKGCREEPQAPRCLVSLMGSGKEFGGCTENGQSVTLGPVCDLGCRRCLEIPGMYEKFLA